MKILITGCSGQLGTDCRTLFADKHDITCTNPDQIDICHSKNVLDSVDALRPDVIINCAAYTAVDSCEKNPTLCHRINAEGPKNLAQAASRYNCRLIHISTDYVFDGKRRPPAGYNETDGTNPLCQYGISKLAGEQAVRTYAKDSLILRTAWLYSAHGKNFLTTILRLALQAPEREINVVNDQYGSLTWSRTLARQIETLLRPEMHGIVHATAVGHSTWYEAACHFLQAMNIPHAIRPCTTAEYPTPARRPANSILLNTRLSSAGISKFTNWQEDLDIFVNHHGKRLILETQ